MTGTALAGATVIAGAIPDDTVSLVVNGQVITGWTEVRITRRCEGIPNDFEVGLTALNPTDGSAVVAYAGQPCTVKVGKDTIITGYIDGDTNAGSADGHRLGIVGRGKCADLVDCAAMYPGGQISGATTLQIASKLAEPYGISAYQLGIQSERTIPQFNLNLGETAQGVIDLLCSYNGLLYYEDEDGDLVLARAGTSTAASGFGYGVNVQDWSVTNSVRERFSEYLCAMVSIAAFTEFANTENIFFKAYDGNARRFRNMYLIAESVSGSQDVCELRGLWEAARRAGRGTAVTVVADSWRDSGGTLWAPNTLAPVSLPGLRLGDPAMLCISEVTFIIDNDRGKVAEVTLLPPAAFQPQPIQIQATPYISGEAKLLGGGTT